MPIEIMGRGTDARSNAWSIDNEGRGQVRSSSEPEDRHINQDTGKVWSIDLDNVLIDAGAYIAWFQNTSQTFYHLTDMRVHCQDLASIIDIDEVTALTIGNATSFLPNQVNSRHISNSTIPTGTMEFATSATGITGLTKVGNIFHAGSLDDKTSYLSTTSNVIIPPGTALGIKVLTANNALGLKFTWSLVEVTHT